MDALRELAGRHGLALFEDAAQAHGAVYRVTKAGALGRAAAFSFYPSKNLGALGDAGAICTDDAELALAARRLRDLGRGDSSLHRVAGYNERLDGLQAALLLVKLSRLDEWNDARRARAAEYGRDLRGALQLLEVAPGADCVYHLFPIRTSDRDELGKLLADHGVATGIHYPVAVPDQPALPELAGTDTPVARDWAARELSLPIFPELTAQQLEWVVEVIGSRP